MPSFKVWLAADTLLYMPVYALADLGILGRVATAAGMGGVSIDIRISPTRGDRATIEHMLRQAEATSPGGDIHIAIADPIRAIQADPAARSVSLLGALIKRPPFWEVGRHPPHEDDVKSHYYVYYNDAMATGNFLGRRAAAHADDEDRDTCKFGEEFERLDGETKTGRTRIITADIRAMVEAMRRDRKIAILRSFSREADLQHFVTTGILTHRKYAADQGKALALFVEALRSACILLRTAEVPTATLVEQIMRREAIKRPSVAGPSTADDLTEIAKDITAQIFLEEIYADSLSVSHAEWEGALKPRGYSSEERRKASAFFFKIYDPHPSRDMTEDWLMRAIKDYGRFVREARRLRGASLLSVISVVVLAVNLGLASQTSSSVVSAHARFLRWSSISSISFAAAAMSAVLLALMREKTRFILPLQKLFAIDDNLATSLALALVTLPALAAASALAVSLGLQVDWSSIVSAAAGIMAAVVVFAMKLWRKRDA
jgi:hypothetical protein